MQRSQARRRIIQGIEATAETRVAARHIPGSKYRNVHTAVLLRSMVTRRLSFPAYVLAYRYHDKLYRAVVNGQSAACVTGTAPISLARIAAAIGIGVAALIGVIGLVVLMSQ